MCGNLQQQQPQKHKVSMGNGINAILLNLHDIFASHVHVLLYLPRSFIHSRMHSFTHALPRARTHACIPSLTHSLTHAFTHSRMHSLTHSLTDSLTCLKVWCRCSKIAVSCLCSSDAGAAVSVSVLVSVCVGAASLSSAMRCCAAWVTAAGT